MNKEDKNIKKKMNNKDFIKCRDYIFCKKDLLCIFRDNKCDGKCVSIHLLIDNKEIVFDEWFENTEEATEEYNNIFEQLQRKKLDKRIINKKKYKITLTEFWSSNEPMAIHCDTEGKVNKLLQIFDNLGERWYDGPRYLDENYYEDAIEEACYDNENNCSPLWWYEENKYKIYEFEDVDLEN